MIYSLQKIINTFGAIADNHLEIDSWAYGFEFEITNQFQSSQNMRQFFVQPINTQVILGRNNVLNDRRFILWCYDFKRQDDMNEISVWNQTEAILIDVIRQFNFGSRDYKVSNQPILTPFADRFGEELIGYFCEIAIQTAENVGTCEIPLKN